MVHEVGPEYVTQVEKGQRDYLDVKIVPQRREKENLSRQWELKCYIPTGTCNRAVGYGLEHRHHGYFLNCVTNYGGRPAGWHHSIVTGYP